MNNPYQTKLDKSRLRALIAEAKERNLTLPPDIFATVTQNKLKYDFPKDANGYYFGKNGRKLNPNPKQEAFFRSTSRYLGLLAGRGSGKSCIGAQKSLYKIEQGLPGAIMNPSFEDFKMSTWPEFREWLDWSMVVPRHRYMGDPGWMPNRPFKLLFLNGAWVICKGLKDPNTARGPNINWLWFDEPGRGDPAGQDWIIANAAVRIGYMPQSWATGTPNGKDHWLYKFFVLQEISEEAIEEFEKSNKLHGIERDLIEYIFTSIDDNKMNLDPSYYASMLAAYPEGWLRQQELYGEFVDKGGILGSAAWFDGKVIMIRPVDNIVGRVRFWDLAASEKKISRGKKTNDPDETVGTLMSWDSQNFYIEDQVSGFWAWSDIQENIRDTALMDGPFVRVVIEQEPGSGGVNQVAAIAEYMKKELPNFPLVVGQKPEGDKITRANVWFAEAAMGKFYMVRDSAYRPWNQQFLNQLGSFPIGRHDDRIDSVSGARLNLAPINLWKEISFLHL